MPELPEVETVRRGLETCVIGKKVLKVKVNRPKTVVGLVPNEFENKVKGQVFKAIKRRAKYLFLELESGGTISVHLKMSGAFLVHNPQIPLPKHSHVVFDLSDGNELRFKDLRAFGRMSFYESFEQAIKVGSIPNLALEPIDPNFTLNYFTDRIKSYSSAVKAVLLDQTKAVSGIGNIYADEALFLSGIQPGRPVNKLNRFETKKLYEALKKVISDSIQAGGTTIRDYVNANGNFGEYALQLYVYGQKKKNCKVCDTPISYIRLAQRGTHFCPSCQS
jgi:formamidopyrimidine-DNA glycosylase